MTPQEMLTRFVQLEKDRRAAEEALSGIKEEIASLQQPIQDYFIAQNVQNINMGGLTVFIRRDLKMRPKNGKDKVLEALHSSGLDEFVRTDYHWMQLNSFLKNYLDENDSLPPDLDDAVEMVEEYSVRTQRRTQ